MLELYRVRAVLLAVVMFFCSLTAHGQTISGTIIAKNSTGISNAHITTNSGAHAHSDLKGRFSIEKVSIGDTLLVTHISYMPTTRIIENPQPLVITLAESSFELAQVEVSHSVKAINSITDVDVDGALNPVTSSQEVLRKVPPSKGGGRRPGDSLVVICGGIINCNNTFAPSAVYGEPLASLRSRETRHRWNGFFFCHYS
jgi:hypothetical protein